MTSSLFCMNFYLTKNCRKNYCDVKYTQCVLPLLPLMTSRRHHFYMIFYLAKNWRLNECDVKNIHTKGNTLTSTKSALLTLGRPWGGGWYPPRLPIFQCCPSVRTLKILWLDHWVTFKMHLEGRWCKSKNLLKIVLCVLAGVPNGIKFYAGIKLARLSWKA